MSIFGAGEHGIFRRKPVDDAGAEEELTDGGDGLERSLGLWQLTALGIGGIIGAGVFSLAGTVANGGRRPGAC